MTRKRRRKAVGQQGGTRSQKYKRYPKPPYSYQGLIAAAILLSPAMALTLQELYDKLQDMFSFFRGTYEGWKESVRHNLSLQSCFTPVVHPECPKSRGNPWTVNLHHIKHASFDLQATPESANFPPSLKTYIEETYSVEWKELEEKSVTGHNAQISTHCCLQAKSTSINPQVPREKDTSQKTIPELQTVQNLFETRLASSCEVPELNPESTLEVRRDLTCLLNIDVSSAMCPTYFLNAPKEFGILQINWVEFMKKQEPNFVPVTAIQQPNFVPVTAIQQPNFVPVNAIQEHNFVPVNAIQEHNFVPVNAIQEHNFVPVNAIQEHNFVPVNAIQQPNYVPVTAMQQHDFEPVMAIKQPNFETVTAIQQPNFETVTTIQQPNFETVTTIQQPNFETVTTMQKSNFVPDTAIQQPNYVPDTAIQQPDFVPVTAIKQPIFVPLTAIQQSNFVPVTAIQQPNSVPLTAIQQPNFVPVTAIQQPNLESITLPKVSSELYMKDGNNNEPDCVHHSLESNMQQVKLPVARSPEGGSNTPQNHNEAVPNFYVNPLNLLADLALGYHKE